MHLFLTEQGHSLVQDTVLPLMEKEHAVFEAMTPEEGQALIQLTRKYFVLLREKSGF